MLVLLIIFLITDPGRDARSIPVELPKERNEVRETKPENIVISVDAHGAHLLERPADAATRTRWSSG